MKIGISIASSYDIENVRDGAQWMLERAKAAADARLDSLFFGDHHVTPKPYYQTHRFWPAPCGIGRLDRPARSICYPSDTLFSWRKRSPHSPPSRRIASSCSVG